MQYLQLLCIKDVRDFMLELYCWKVSLNVDFGKLVG